MRGCGGDGDGVDFKFDPITVSSHYDANVPITITILTVGGGGVSDLCIIFVRHKCIIMYGGA